MAKAFLVSISLFCIISICSCRTFYNNISNKVQTSLSIVFDTCNIGIIDSVSNIIFIRQKEDNILDRRNTKHRFNCNTTADTIKLTQINEKEHSLYIRRTFFDSLNYKIQTISSYNIIQSSDTNMEVKINSIIAFKSNTPLKSRNDTAGYIMENILRMQRNKKRN